MIVIPKPTKDIQDAGFNEYMVKTEGGINSNAMYGHQRNNLVDQDLQSFSEVDNKSLRIHKVGALTISSGTYDPIFGSWTATETARHDLGYFPVALGYYKDGVSEVYKPIPDTRLEFVSGGGYDGYIGISLRVDETYIYFDVISYPGVTPSPTEPDFPYDIKYYIFREELE
jgi:hypothetical protein